MVKVQVKEDHIVFPCGCEFNILDKKPIRIDFDPNMESIPLDCSLTWDLIGSGNTKGVFQLESNFGQQYAKKLKPKNIEHLAALGAILRPGCINNITDGKSVTDRYIDRKNGVEEVTYFHPALEPILQSTYGELVYQEQAMKIAQQIAGFDLQQADVLRKAIGKKKADVMAKVKKQFLEGCKKEGVVTDEEATEIFGWIEKSQRYSFNKSHAVSYAINGYLSAYEKAHFPISFFTSYLFFAKEKQKPFEEIKLLVNNAKLLDIDVRPPDFRHFNTHFKHIGPCVFFGFTDIKGVGESAIKDLQLVSYQTEQALGKKRDGFTWTEFLVYIAPKVNKTCIEGMIESGALDYMNIARQRMLFEYNQYKNLKDKKEEAWIQQHIIPSKHNNLVGILEMLISWYDLPEESRDKKNKPCANKNRVQKVRDMIDILKNPPHSLEDNIDWIARVEEAKMGLSITTSVVDACKDASQANCTCMDFLKHQESNHGIFIAAQIDSVNTHIDSNGNEMAFVEISDNDSSLKCIIFSDTWKEIRRNGICIQDNVVMVSGDRSQRGDDLIIKKIWQLS